MPFNPAIPQRNHVLANSQIDLLANYQEINQWLGINHFPFGDPKEGKHKYLQFRPRIIDNVTLGANGEIVLQTRRQTEDFPNLRYFFIKKPGQVQKLFSFDSAASERNVDHLFYLLGSLVNISSGFAMWTSEYSPRGTGTRRITLNYMSVAPPTVPITTIRHVSFQFRQDNPNVSPYFIYLQNIVSNTEIDVVVTRVSDLLVSEVARTFIMTIIGEI